MNLFRCALLSATLVPLAGSASAANADVAGSPSKIVKAAVSPELERLRGKAELGDGQAQYDLGAAYHEGRGTEQDLVEAFAWLRLASEKGVTGPALKSVTDSLQLSQLALARLRLESLRADFPSLRVPLAPPGAKASDRETAGPLGGATASSAVKSTPGPAAAGTFPRSEPGPAVDTRLLKEQLNAAESLLLESQKELSKQSAELAHQRADSVVDRIELDFVKAQLASAKDALAGGSQAEALTPAAAALLEKERAAHASTQSALENVQRQLAELASARAALERELAARVPSERVKGSPSSPASPLTTPTGGSLAQSSAPATALANIDPTRPAPAAPRSTTVVTEPPKSTGMAPPPVAKSAVARPPEPTPAKQGRVTTTPPPVPATAAKEAPTKEPKWKVLRSVTSALERKPQAVKSAALEPPTKSPTETLVAALHELAETDRELTRLQRTIIDLGSQPGSTTDLITFETELHGARTKLSAAVKSSGEHAAEVSGRPGRGTEAGRSRMTPAELEAARREGMVQVGLATEELAALRTRAAIARAQSRIQPSGLGGR